MKPNFHKPIVTGMRLGWQSDAVYHRYSRRCSQTFLIRIRSESFEIMRVRVPRLEFVTEIAAEIPEATLSYGRVIRSNHVRISVLGRELTVFHRPHSRIVSGWQPQPGTPLPSTDVPYTRLIPRSRLCGRR